MKVKINGCVDCSLPCLGYCRLRDDSYEWYCDDCGEQFAPKELREYLDGSHLCEKCLLDKFEILE